MAELASSRLRANVERVRERIADAAVRAGRSPDEVTLVAVSKTRPAEDVAEVAACGIEQFGENRVQEAADKIPRVHALLGRDLTWHLIGTLQRNKVRPALDLFATIQSVDSVRLAQALAERTGERQASILLEVYLGDDPERPGFRPSDLPGALEAILSLPSLEVRGLMTVAPLGYDEQGTRSAFRRLRELRNVLASAYPGAPLRELSMGMTNDFPLAIAEGATIVRVGRAIFGERT
ncbi:MAG: YggS family pyridoxal phosphate-dependent enzyme [Chloroflexi bacterium]|nr:YggS family pyridoxal phosphate-dependent enzyme [Chloroflexota bacterium]